MGETSEGSAPVVNSRLVVELSSKVREQLTELVEIEEINKTTITNRAVQLYYMIGNLQRAGGKVYIQEPGSNELQRLTLL